MKRKFKIFMYCINMSHFLSIRLSKKFTFKLDKTTVCSNLTVVITLITHLEIYTELYLYVLQMLQCSNSSHFNQSISPVLTGRRYLKRCFDSFVCELFFHPILYVELI